MANTTRRPRRRRNAAITPGSVVTGNPNSAVCCDELVLADDRLVRTHREVLERLAGVCVHSRRVCPSSDSEGTSTSDRLLPRRSAIHIAASVLPVPHAMINWPRSLLSESLDGRVDGLAHVGKRLLTRGSAGPQIVGRLRPCDLRKLQLRAQEIADRLAWASSVRRAVGPRWSVVAISSR